MKKEGTIIYVDSIDDNGNNNYVDLKELNKVTGYVKTKIKKTEILISVKMDYDEDNDILYLTTGEKEEIQNKVAVDITEFIEAFEDSILNLDIVVFNHDIMKPYIEQLLNT